MVMMDQRRRAHRSLLLLRGSARQLNNYIYIDSHVYRIHQAPSGLGAARSRTGLKAGRAVCSCHVTVQLRSLDHCAIGQGGRWFLWMRIDDIKR